MKHSRIFQISAVAIVLALLVTAIPATPALAQSVTAYPSSGPIGTSFTVYGSGFTTYPDGTPVYIFWNTTISTVATVTGGSFAAPTSVPIGSTPGINVVSVWPTSMYGTGTALGSTTFTVTGRQIAISPSSGHVGSTVTVSGTGFNASSSITITFDATTVITSPASVTTNTLGTFTNATFTVPDSCRGSHTVKAKDASNYYDTASFTTQPSITLSPTSGAVGDEVTVSGTGFRASRSITITFDGDTVTTSPATVTTNNDGSFSNTTFTVPAAVNDTYEVEVSDGYYTGSVNFAVAAGVTISPITSPTSPGYVGDTVTVSGTGFLVNHLVTITYLSAPITVATTTTNANGDFSATFEVPASEGGDHTITATDGTNTITSTFTMESTAPAIPAPLLPLMDSKAGAEAHFDWEDVTDPSLPVTYTLQIATDDQFTTESILLEKTGITESEYTLTSEESLASVERENPYHWRVKAIDGASNESGWTGIGSFYVGFSFHMPTWLIYTLFGLGALLIGVFGFWLGRKTAYS